MDSLPKPIPYAERSIFGKALVDFKIAESQGKLDSIKCPYKDDDLVSGCISKKEIWQGALEDFKKKKKGYFKVGLYELLPENK